MELYDRRKTSNHRVMCKCLAILCLSAVTVIIKCSIIMIRNYNVRYSTHEVQFMPGEIPKTPELNLFRNNISHITRQPSSKPPKALPYFNPRLWPLDTELPIIINKTLSGKPAGISPINGHPYVYLNSSTQNCAILDSLDPLVVILVKSAAVHFKNRLVIRRTWGYSNFTASLGVKIVFLLGTDYDHASLQTSVEHESKTFGDIVQESFNDTYYNNTLKTTMAFNWIAEFCNAAKYVMFVDDDYFVATDKTVSFLKSFNHTEDVYIGKKNSYLKPHRFLNSKWYVSREIYPFRNYPLFLDAGAYVMTMNVAKKFQIAIQYTESYIFDDVFLAIVASKSGITPIHNDLFSVKQTFDTGLAIHNYNYERVAFTWELYSQLYKITF